MRSPKLPALLVLALVMALFTPQVSQAQYLISTVAGGGPINLAELSASIGYPTSVAFDKSGNIYIADSYSSQVFVVNTGTQAITVATIVVQPGDVAIVAGNGTSGYSGDGGPATSAALGINGPQGVAVDGSGNIFIADTENSVIREVVASTGYIQTVAGNATQGPGYFGDGGLATSAQLDDPTGVFVDSTGDIFIADADNFVIREVVASTGDIQTVAGNNAAGAGYSGDGAVATSAQLDFPEGVFSDASGNIFIADTENNVIRVVNTGTAQITVAGVTILPTFIQTVAGAYYDSEGGSACLYSGTSQPALSADLCIPSNIFVDASENIYIADSGNQTVREVSSGGTIQTVAGDGTEGYSGDLGTATLAELNYPNNMVVDSSGDIFIADTDNSAIREVTISNSDIQTIIGNGFLAYAGDGGLPVDAELNYPSGVVLDTAGDIFISDTDSSVIREVVATTGDIQTVVGTGVPCSASTATCGDGAAAASAQLNNPYGVFLDASGNIFIADFGDNRIRVVNTGSAALALWGLTIPSGEIATVAGNGTLCPDSATACGDGGAAISAELAGPTGVFVDSAENIFIADTSDHVIREVAASSGIITTVAGNYKQCSSTSAACGDTGLAISAQLSDPGGVFVDLSENIYIADTGDNRIREVTASNANINTVAGTGVSGYSGDGAVATSALLAGPSGVFVDNSGDIFVADTANSVIREVVAATGFIDTVAGDNALGAGFSGDGEQATLAQLNSPFGLSGDSKGNLFVADTDNSRVRKLLASIFVTVTPNPVNVVVNALQQFTATVTGTGNTAVTWQVNGVTGGNSTVGTITTTGLFQAPASVPAPATVTITAISAADGTTSGSAQATIVNASTTVTVTVSSGGATQVYTTTTQQFTATVTGTTNTAVNWQVNGATGGNATVGTINTSGLYTAPSAVPSPATVVIEAVSQADSTAIGTASIMIVTDPSASQPTAQTTSPGGTATYSISLNANTGTPGLPITLSCLQSTLPAGATCNFSPTTITPGAQAVPFSLTITVPASSASLEKRDGTKLHLYFAFAFVPLAGILFAGAGLRNQRRRWLWLAGLGVALILLNACGGGGSGTTGTGPTTYNVKVQGTTTAQPNPVTITTATLTVQ
ncbi:MAG: hypothetical protein WCF68_15760 [Terriglobales bacterium]